MKNARLFLPLFLFLACSHVVYSAPVQKDEEEQPFYKNLKPIEDNRRGLLVGEPVAEDPAGPLAGFGAACSRWLYFVVGGHGELGKTPVWDEVRLAIENNNRFDLQLLPSDVALFGSALAVTDIATSEIKGSPGKIELSYQLWNVAGEKKQGEPLRLSGTEEEILKNLPGTARELAKRLGIAEPRLPALSISPADMTYLGTLQWGTYYNKVPTRLRGVGMRVENSIRLQTQALREPFIDVLLSINGSTRKRQDKAEVEEYKKNRAQNVLYLEAMGMEGREEYDYFCSEEARSIAEYPHNYALACAATSYLAAAGKFGEAREYAELAIRLSPRNPYAWVALAYQIGKHANSIRRARYAGDITDNEWQVLEVLYRDAFLAALRAPELAPDNCTAWRQLSSSATFAGVEELAVSSILKAQEANPYSPAVYRWACEIFNPKWFGDVEALGQLVKNMPDSPELFLRVRKDLINVLSANKMQEQVKKMEELTEPALRRAIAETPNDEDAWAYFIELGPALRRSGRLQELRELQEQFIKNRNSVTGLLQLSRMLLPDPLGEECLLKVMKIDSGNVTAFMSYVRIHQNDEPAEREKASLRIGEYAPESYFGYFAPARFHETMQAYDKAIEYARKALGAHPNENQRKNTYRLLLRCLQAQNKTEEVTALKAEALKLGIDLDEPVNTRPLPQPRARPNAQGNPFQ